MKIDKSIVISYADTVQKANQDNDIESKFSEFMSTKKDNKPVKSTTIGPKGGVFSSGSIGSKNYKENTAKPHTLNFKAFGCKNCGGSVIPRVNKPGYSTTLRFKGNNSDDHDFTHNIITKDAIDKKHCPDCHEKLKNGDTGNKTRIHISDGDYQGDFTINLVPVNKNRVEKSTKKPKLLLVK